MKNKLKDILNDNEFYQPAMIIEEKEPFWWRLNPNWVEDKVKQIEKLYASKNKKTKNS